MISQEINMDHSIHGVIFEKITESILYQGNSFAVRSLFAVGKTSKVDT